jgi:streptomycin 6-kinase
MQSLPIPAEFASRMTEVYGPLGESWLAELPALLASLSVRWSLGYILPPFEPLSYNYVAPVLLTNGTPAVLKAGVPNPELTSEIEALRLYNGDGAVRLLEADPNLGAMLLERLVPGRTLFDLDDDVKATSIAAQVMTRLWRPVSLDHSFPTVKKWTKGLERQRDRFGGTSGPLPESLVSTAEGLFCELLASNFKQVLLHGDLHHWNILSAERQPWMALDPKGVVGDPAYEIAAWLRNPTPHLLSEPDPRRILARRIDQFVEELGFERERILGWGLAHAVLSACWSIEDHGQGWEPAIRVAEILAEMAV